MAESPFKGLSIKDHPVSKEEFISWYDDYVKRCSNRETKNAHKTQRDFMDEGHNVIEVVGNSVILNGLRINVNSVTIEHDEVTLKFKAIPYYDPDRLGIDDLSRINQMY